jgi:CRP-like cAMP-binding protein
MNASQHVLYKSSPLKSLPLPLLQEIWGAGEQVEKRRGETIFKEGDPSDGTLFMVVEGELAVMFNRADGTLESKERTAGDLLGESALVNRDHTRTATVRVVSDFATLMRWDGNALLEQPNMEPLAKQLGSLAWQNTRETEDLKKF